MSYQNPSVLFSGGNLYDYLQQRMHNNMLLEEEVGISYKVVLAFCIAKGACKKRSTRYFYYLDELDWELIFKKEVILNTSISFEIFPHVNTVFN